MRILRSGLALLLPVLALAACTAPPNGEALVSAQFPPGTGFVNDNGEPQPINSLPPGAANFSRAPGGTQPDFASITLGGFGR